MCVCASVSMNTFHYRVVSLFFSRHIKFFFPRSTANKNWCGHIFGGGFSSPQGCSSRCIANHFGQAFTCLTAAHFPYHFPTDVQFRGDFSVVEHFYVFKNTGPDVLIQCTWDSAWQGCPFP